MLEYITTVFTDPEKMTPDLLGGKGYHLAKMVSMGLPVPHAGILTTAFFAKHFHPEDVKSKKTLIDDVMMDELRTMLDSIIWTIENDHTLISVRSGAKISMPGMMDTILNVGITSKTRPGLIAKYGEELVDALEIRLIRMYADVVFGVDVLDYPTPTLVRDEYQHKVGIPFFDTVEEQVLNAVVAVFESWYNERAVKYREINNIPHDIGTAVVLQKMVFGNKDSASCTGVYFTGNPNTGDTKHTGEFLVGAQGEDVVSGEVTPDNVEDLDFDGPHKGMTHAFKQLAGYAHYLTEEFRDMQDIEFTIESGELYILQTRSAKRTDRAALRFVTEKIKKGWSFQEGDKALSYVTPELIGRMFRETIHPDSLKDLQEVCSGLAVGGGLVQGKPVFDREDAVAGTIFMTEYTTPDDLDAMLASEGVVTRTGGATSHAAIVARSLGKPAVVGCGDSVGNVIGNDWIVIDGDAGKVYKTLGGQPVVMVQGEATPEFLEFAKMVWGKDLDTKTNYVRPFSNLEESSCIARIFGVESTVAGTNTPKDPVEETDIPEEVLAFLESVNIKEETIKVITSKGFKISESCYDRDPVVVALNEILKDKD